MAFTRGNGVNFASAGVKEYNFSLTGKTGSEAVWTQKNGNLGVSTGASLNITIDADSLAATGSIQLLDATEALLKIVGADGWLGLNFSITVNGITGTLSVQESGSGNLWTGIDLDDDNVFDIGFQLLQTLAEGKIELTWSKNSNIFTENAIQSLAIAENSDYLNSIGAADAGSELYDESKPFIGIIA